jgi:hypothetical protein
MHLHPQIGAGVVGYTAQLTRVKRNTLIGWLSKPPFVSCWLPMVANITANDLLSALPPTFQECFSVINSNSTVKLERYHRIARKNKGTQLKIAFTGAKDVRDLYCFADAVPRGKRIYIYIYIYICIYIYIYRE